jgi:hypothetical protein
MLLPDLVVRVMNMCMIVLHEPGQEIDCSILCSLARPSIWSASCVRFLVNILLFNTYVQCRFIVLHAERFNYNLTLVPCLHCYSQDKNY